MAGGASGDWAGQDLRIAAWQDGAWSFHAPRPGWLCRVGDEGLLVAWDGAAWIEAGAATGGGGGGGSGPARLGVGLFWAAN